MSILTNQIGINIAQNAIQLVEINRKENKIYLENVDEEFFEESIYLETKETKFIHILQNAFNEIILRKPLLASKILISLPISFFDFFEIPIDKNITKNDLNEYIDWEFKKLFPLENKADFYFQKVYLETPNYLSYKRILLCVINKNILKRIFKFCLRNNLKLELIDVSHFAANSILSYCNRYSYYLSIFFEDNKFSIMLFNGSNFVFSRIKNFENISDIPEFIKTIISEIEERNMLKTKIEMQYLFGSTISNELVKNLENLLKINSTIIDPFHELKMDISHLKQKILSTNFTKFSSALGMALRLAS